MKNITFFFLLILCNCFAQKTSTDQIYFIGEKLNEKQVPIFYTYIPAERQDCKNGDEDEKCYPTVTTSDCFKFTSNYKILKILKGTFDKKSIEFNSLYCNEFEYRRPLKKKYAVIGLLKDADGKYQQNYIERVYLKSKQWILPYSTNYPFINYKLVSPQKLKKRQRIKININEQYSLTYHIQIYDEYYYDKIDNYAISLYGFIL